MSPGGWRESPIKARATDAMSAFLGSAQRRGGFPASLLPAGGEDGRLREFVELLAEANLELRVEGAHSVEATPERPRVLLERSLLLVRQLSASVALEQLANGP